MISQSLIRYLKRSKVHAKHTSAWPRQCLGPLVFQAGYHPCKKVFITHPKHVFSRYENRPNIYALAYFCHYFQASFFFPKFMTITKNTPFFFPNFGCFCTLNDVCAYFAWSWNTAIIMWFFFFTRIISNFKYKCPPPPGAQCVCHAGCLHISECCMQVCP